MRLPRLIFAPRGATRDQRWLRSLLRELRKGADVLFVAAEDGSDLPAGALPGTRTLLSPRFPSLLDDALALSDGAITRCPIFAERARIAGTPCWLLRDDDLRLSPARAAARYLEQASPRHEANADSPERATALEICTVADHRYLPILVGFLANLRRHAFPLSHVHLLTLDDKLEAEVRTRYPSVQRYRPAELWTPAEWETISSRGPGARAFSSKPRLLQQVLRRTQRPVLYSDLDIFYYGSPEPLAGALGEAPALLFPQWNDRLWHSKFYGVFNAGMLAVGHDAEPFLAWWSERCLRDYNGNMLQGYYADQGFLDLAPVHFPLLRIYRDRDHNVAYWNLGTLIDPRKTSVGNLPRLLNGKEMLSFHAAVPDALGIYEWKFAWDQIQSFFAGVPENWSELAEEMVIQQQSEHWLAVSRLRKIQQNYFSSLHLWSPRTARLLLHSPLRHALHAGARLHYQYARVRRWLWPEPDLATDNRSHLALLRPSDDRQVMW